MTFLTARCFIQFWKRIRLCEICQIRWRYCHWGIFLIIRWNFCWRSVHFVGETSSGESSGHRYSLIIRRSFSSILSCEFRRDIIYLTILVPWYFAVVDSTYITNLHRYDNLRFYKTKVYSQNQHFFNNLISD